MNDETMLFILISLPFAILGLGVVIAVRSGFFVTYVKPVIPKEQRFYIDKVFGHTTPIVLLTIGFSVTAWVVLKYGYLEGLLSFIFLLSFICLRLVHKHFILMQNLVWQEYLYFPGRHEQRYNSRYRFYYPIPEIKEEDLNNPATNRDSEMVYLFKLFKSHETWNSLRAEIRKKFFHLGRRCLLYRTTGQVSSQDVCNSWADYGVEGMTPISIWNELKAMKTFPEFAQCWYFYAILVSRKTIKSLNRTLFSPYIHSLLILFAYLMFLRFSPSISDMQQQLRAILFGLSFLCSVVYSGVALMLYIYGKVSALEDLSLPLGKMGDPLFRATSHTAMLVSISTAITVGIGIPISLSYIHYSTMISAGLVIGGIFFVSVWGTHFSMENTKNRAINKVILEIRNERELSKIELLKFRYKEIAGVPVWPMNIVVVVNLFFAIILPIIFQKLLSGLF